MTINIEEIKAKVIMNVGFDPFSDPESWEIFREKIPEGLWGLLTDPEGATEFLKELPIVFPPDTFFDDKRGHRCWELIGNFYKNQKLLYQAISIYISLYNHFLQTQEISKKRIRKGTPLVWISECYYAMGFPAIAKRYLMLSLCENAIHEKGQVPPKTTGTYWRLVYRHGLPDTEVSRYAAIAYNLSQHHKEEAFFPEWIVQEFDKDWIVEIPSANEAAVYVANTLYIKKLISNLGEGQGKILEKLAEYVLSCMPGCRTTRRQKTESTDYDIICSIEGFEVDFRSEFGRYFVCECKDWERPANFTMFAKFCRVLDSVKSRFGILFSKNGISGEGETKYAEREQLKIFQDRGMVIIVIDSNDLSYVADGGNLMNLLRAKYEKVRLDLKSTTK